MNRSKSILAAVSLLGSLLSLGVSPAHARSSDVLVSVGSPSTPFPQNRQVEPAVAIDPAHPNVVVAGARDTLDVEACGPGDPTTCPFTDGVGDTAVYFSFDRGASWEQPTNTGWTARDCLGPDECQPHIGPIGTLPGYYEAGLLPIGRAVMAFGPKPDQAGDFSWANGSRLYSGNIVENLGGIQGDAAMAVSRTDDVTAAAAGNSAAWMTPVIASKQSSSTYSDNDQIWADNAKSSPFFGNVYACYTQYRPNAVPLFVATSTDGGEKWANDQVTPATTTTNSTLGVTPAGCSIRTDSDGIVYVFAEKFFGPGVDDVHILVKSFDGGNSWTKPRTISGVGDVCFAQTFNGDGFSCVLDGPAGAVSFSDSEGWPSVAIANGAPTGVGATNIIYRTWVDGRDGVNHEHVMVSYSTDGARSWSTPIAVEQPGDRGLFSAIALSPSGTDAYVVYLGFTTPLRDNTTDPRGMVGVVLHSDLNEDGTPTGFTEIYRGVEGDPRGSSQLNRVTEFVGEYVYVAATDAYGIAVWTDARNAADCPAIDVWRAKVQVTQDLAGRPAPGTDCPPTFGNTDIYGVTLHDPTP